MTAPTKTLRTPAEGAIAARFAAVRDRLPGAAGVKAEREQAFARFEREGLPHRRVEEWKYSDLRARLKSAPPLAARPDAEAGETALAATEDAFAAVDRHRLVLVDGWFQPHLSDVTALTAERVEVAGLADVLATDGPRDPDLMAVPEIATPDIAVALNTAFVSDGVVVEIPDGVRLSKPLEITHVASPGEAAARAARVNVILGANAAATVIVNAIGGEPDGETNLVVDYRLGDGARLTAVQRQREHPGAVHLASTFARLAADTTFRHLTVAAGADFARHQSFVSFAGRGARAELYGATMVDGTRHIDQTLVVDHAVPDCVSAELFKTAIDDRATAVFQGRILVRRDAQKTNGKMMSQALLLSEEAQMASKPELEIFADDVVCGHGSTSGQIDPTQLFYLMARGVPRREAERLLIEAFLDEAIDAVGDEAIADALKRTVSAWLAARGGEA
jgi:Fe-S cluster assembly protein SufD